MDQSWDLNDSFASIPPKFNPIELVFNDLVQNLRVMSARYGSVSNDQFVNTAETI